MPHPRTVWTRDPPDRSSLPADATVLYVPGYRISSHPVGLLLTSVAQLAGRPTLPATALRNGSLKGVGRSQMAARSVGMLGLPNVEPGWLAALVEGQTWTAGASLDPAEVRARGTAVIITQNRAPQLRRAIESVKGHLCDQVVVVDGGSDDSTPDVARQLGALVVHRPFAQDFADQRNHGIAAAERAFQPHWIARIDDDEVVPADLAQLALRVLATDPRADAIYCPRVTQVGNDEPWGRIDMAPLLHRPGLRYRKPVHEVLSTRRPVFLPVNGPALMHHKTYPQLFRSASLYESIAPGSYNPGTLAWMRDAARDSRADEEGE